MSLPLLPLPPPPAASADGDHGPVSGDFDGECRGRKVMERERFTLAAGVRGLNFDGGAGRAVGSAEAVRWGWAEGGGDGFAEGDGCCSGGRGFGPRSAWRDGGAVVGGGVGGPMMVCLKGACRERSSLWMADEQ